MLPEKDRPSLRGLRQNKKKKNLLLKSKIGYDFARWLTPQRKLKIFFGQVDELKTLD